MNSFNHPDRFVNRHIGLNENDIKEMLYEVGAESIDTLIEETIPPQIRLKEEISLDQSLSEFEYLNKLRQTAQKNKVFKSYIGMGYYNTILPAAIQRNVLENPGWYTQYTPYQAEISQGRLEALINYQTMVMELTSMPIANASLLDEATAAAEAMNVSFAYSRSSKKNTNKFFVDEDVFPQTLAVLQTRAVPQGIEIVVGKYDELKLTDDFFGLLVQYPSGKGSVNDYSDFFSKADAIKINKIVAADILSLALLKPPGEFGADIVVGSTQRFGVPMGFGGPHAAYFACKEEFKRIIPGRIIGASIDVHGRPALRMALQTREQHIKREKATSNICTAQVLLAIMAGMYAVYHGPEGIQKIAERVHKLTNLLNSGLKQLNIRQLNAQFFDTLIIDLENQTDKIERIKKTAAEKKINFRYFENRLIGISLDETTSVADVKEILEVMAKGIDTSTSLSFEKLDLEVESSVKTNLRRKSNFLTQKVFKSNLSETELLRYIKSLENRDLSLTTSMIPLGSCTMKLNAASEMLGVTFPEFTNIHPFVPLDQTEGYQQIIKELEYDLAAITGFAAVSLQPNSGAQGEFAGLMVIRAFHHSKGESKRNVVLIPSSAHGTNPASAVMAGMKVVVVKCDEKGNIDVNDLIVKAEQNKENLSSLMVTYPSTHGVFEENIIDICKIVHKNGGQVYMDGANLNAQLGFTTPKLMGADVCHLNLHKTFAIPHGGGGPGVGPIAVAEHLKQFLPSHPIISVGGEKGISSISAAPWGSANVLIISHAYIKMMGSKGLKKATETAILNANYIKAKLEKHFRVLYTGSKGRVAHELIFDMREFKSTANIEVEDIAKRLMDYGFHAPTVSFPVPGTLMVEPTESESKYELDRFCNAMIMIRQEIKEIERGNSDKVDNVLKNAPHTSLDVVSDTWNHKYSREKAAFPAEWTKRNKFWPYVGRINSAHGDRNLVCSCEPISSYEIDQKLD
ncbi:MAG: aminomethyl-transferring glycine dehydrogenase [Ignavibacteria bacterium]|nr:aminomethyl-transferring glycine dehydrogenase [Ignavibacteria bacterium]